LLTANGRTVTGHAASGGQASDQASKRHQADTDQLTRTDHNEDTPQKRGVSQTQSHT